MLVNTLLQTDQIFNDAVMAELKSPELCAKNLRKSPQKKALVAGLTVLSSNVEDNSGALAQRRKRLKEFRVDREKASLEMMELGIEPLGIVPVIALEKLFDEGGLIRLCPDADGKVHIQADKSVREALSKVRLTAKEICKIVFPRGRSPEKSECSERVKGRDSYYQSVTRTYDRRALVRIAFPQPPADVQKILHTARKLPIKVAAVPEAITFLDDLQTAVSQRLKAVERQKKADEKRAIEEALRRARQYDPIVYTEFGTAAVVLAQFGEFEIEKKIIEAVANSQYLV